MRAHGSDRVRRGEGDQWLLASRLPKGWHPRVEKTLTTSQHPGTAVLIEDQYYEVVSITPRATGVEYQLEPWRDEHVMRHVDRYDAESEQARIEEHRRAAQRAVKRRSTLAAGLITGQFPAAVQEHYANELGIVAHRLTMVSTIPAWAAFGFCLWLIADARLQKVQSPVALPLLIVVALLSLESATRFVVAWTQNRPMGSLPGVLLYSLYYFIAPNRAQLVAPFQIERGTGITFTVPKEEELRGALAIRAPLMTLLTPVEQQKIARRFNYSFHRDAVVVAWIALLCAGTGAFSILQKLQAAPSLLRAVSFLVAAIVAVEQPLRLLKLRSSSAAASLLAPLVRPLARKLLDAPPPDADHA
jgi:hypothetical protein